MARLVKGREKEERGERMLGLLLLVSLIRRALGSLDCLAIGREGVAGVGGVSRARGHLGLLIKSMCVSCSPWHGRSVPSGESFIP